MQKRISRILLLAFILSTLLVHSVLAQDYYFQVPVLHIDVYWNSDGSASIEYVFRFINDASGPIEYVDLGLPNDAFSESQITAEIDGIPLTYISRSEFQGEGSSGVAIGLGSHSIPPGNSGTVKVFVPYISNVLYVDSDNSDYASAVFKNPYFTSHVVHGSTDLSVTFHLPPGIQPDEPRWHASPSGFPEEPEAGFDTSGNITYRWQNSNASIDYAYEFGASFPNQYVPPETIAQPPSFGWVNNIPAEACLPIICFGFGGIIIIISVVTQSRRKMQYLPPKITIEGHGIKRGLTAVEAAILLEQPLDKVLTMILFGVVKKGAAEVTQRDPLKLKVQSPLPEGLYEYEKNFLEAFQEQSKSGKQKKLETTIVTLVKSIAEKMKGFSRAETIEYYKNITKRAWAQVEAANTPEVKSEKYHEVMEWTMLDRNYDDRTQDVFRHQPVIVPTWWGHFDPTYTPRPSPSTISAGKPSLGGTSLPHLPGSDFAASIANGVQSFSAGVVGNISAFTSRITNVTNPVPKTTTTYKGGYKGGGGSSGGRSCACACACACAGCACACAGGGR